MKKLFTSLLFGFFVVFVFTFSHSTRAISPTDYGLKEGDLISAIFSDDPDVYIVNEHGYKRLFLNPDIFNFYSHLGGFFNVKLITQEVRDSFPTSGLFRNCEDNDKKVFGIDVEGEDEGQLHWVNTTGEQAVADDPDFFKKVFCINKKEFNWYKKADSFSSVIEVPKYDRIPDMEKISTQERLEAKAETKGIGKVTICHYPPENIQAYHTLTIGASALKAHLDHGDTVGACLTPISPATPAIPAIPAIPASPSQPLVSPSITPISASPSFSPTPTPIIQPATPAVPATPATPAQPASSTPTPTPTLTVSPTPTTTASPSFSPTPTPISAPTSTPTPTPTPSTAYDYDLAVIDVVSNPAIPETSKGFTVNVTLKNVGQKTLKSVTAALTIYDPNGQKFHDSAKGFSGSIGAGNTGVVTFDFIPLNYSAGTHQMIGGINCIGGTDIDGTICYNDSNPSNNTTTRTLEIITSTTTSQPLPATVSLVGSDGSWCYSSDGDIYGSSVTPDHNNKGYCEDNLGRYEDYCGGSISWDYYCIGTVSSSDPAFKYGHVKCSYSGKTCSSGCSNAACVVAQAPQPQKTNFFGSVIKSVFRLFGR